MSPTSFRVPCRRPSDRRRRPDLLWASDLQFGSTVDRKAIKIASMIDEHTRVSLLNVVERSSTADRLVTELETVFAAAGGPPIVLRLDNGPELIYRALQQFCDGKTGMSYIRLGTSWNNGHIESFNNRLRKECLNRAIGISLSPSTRLEETKNCWRREPGYFVGSHATKRFRLRRGCFLSQQTQRRCRGVLVAGERCGLDGHRGGGGDEAIVGPPVGGAGRSLDRDRCGFASLEPDGCEADVDAVG